MEVPFTLQALQLLKAVGAGLFLGALYSVTSLLRLFARRRGFMAVLLDFLFMLAAGIAAILFLVRHSDGQLRLFLLFGMAAGFMLFYWTVGALLRMLERRLFAVLEPKARRFKEKNAARSRKLRQKLKKRAKLSKNHLKDGRHMLYNQWKQGISLFHGRKRGKAYEQTAKEKNE